MKQCKIVIKKLILIIVLTSILIMFLATPASNAKLDLEDGEFYYSGSTEGSYKPQGSNIFGWILKALGEIADFILGILTLAPRMVAVGWTALMEKGLTWAVESSAGVSADGTVVESPTDLTAVTDSNNNVTVESIVYNKVAALDANPFNLEIDRTISPTGHKLFCDKCEIYTDEFGIDRYRGKYVTDCCNQSIAEDIKKNPDNYKDKTIKDVSGFCTCKCGGEDCYACSTYFEQLKVGKPTIIIIKENIATWYYILRMLAMAVMLIVLIGIGIKMAISTIASEKAIYKRMLVDWVVGVIMLFTLHYFMLFVFNLNTIMVDVVQETAQSVNKESLERAAKDLKMDLEDELHSKDLEIRIYEEIRTRAYDAKLSNGMIGMVMYITLVFMAIKYTFIYLKRMLTIMVLTLMAPGVGVAYALQRVMTGKSQALKLWMTEYIMNVIIQIIHALIYAIFVSQALIMSLTNIAGMIFALVLLNYAAKAEGTFKKVFKFGGKDSLVGATDSAAEAMNASIKSAINIATGAAVGAKPAAKILTNTPYAKALKGAGKMAAAGAFKHMSKKFQASQKHLNAMDINKFDNLVDATTEAFKQVDPQMSDEAAKNAAIKHLASQNIVNPRFAMLASGQLTGQDAKDAFEAKLNFQKLFENEKAEADQELKAARDEKKQLEQKKEKDSASVSAAEMKAAEEKEKQAENKSNFYGAVPGAQVAAVRNAHNLFSMENQFNMMMPDGSLDQENASFSRMAFGTTTFDPVKMKYVNNKDSAFDKLISPQMFGWTDKDKKMFKEHVMPLAKGVLGMGSFFVGMGTVVTNPGMGFGLLASGTMQMAGATRTVKSISKEKNRYTFNRFPSKTIGTMEKNATELARKERRSINFRRLKEKRPNFVENLMNGNIEAATLALGVGLAVSPTLTAIHAYRSAKKVFFPKPDKEGKPDVAAIVQQITNGEGAKETSVGDKGTVDNVVEVPREVKPSVFIRVLSKNEHYSALVDYAKGVNNDAEKEFKRESKTLRAEQLKAEQKHIFENLDKKTEDQGYEYDKIQDLLVRKETVKKTDIKADFKPKKETKGKPAEKVIDEKLDKILQNVSQRSNLDLSSKSVQKEIIEKLDKELRDAKLISDDQSVTSVFKQGEAGLIKVIKGKAGKLQDKKAADEELRSAFTQEEISTVNAVMKKSKGKKGASITEILAEMSGALNAQNDGSQAVSTKDGSGRVDSSKTGDVVAMFGGEKKAAAIQAYVTANVSTPKTVTSKKKVVADMLDSVMKQYASPDTATEVAEGKKKANDAEKVIKELKGSLRGAANSAETQVVSVGTDTFELDKSSADAAGDVVKNLLEMMELNKESIEDIKRPTKKYAEKKVQKSTFAIDASKLAREAQNETDKEKRTKLDQIKEFTKQAEIQSGYDLKMVGPAIDITEVIGNIKNQANGVNISDGSRSYSQKQNTGKTKKKGKAGGK